MEEIRLIEVKEGILSENDRIATELRQQLAEKKIFLMNLMASPGAGKTTLIIRTIEALKERFATGVIEADIDSMVDAEKSGGAGYQNRSIENQGIMPPGCDHGDRRTDCTRQG